MKRCCETCKFFAKGALAGSGWCRHPERVDVNNDLVLVRASQLTCRRGWDQDSWEAITREARTRDRFPRDVQLGPQPPVSHEDFTAIINADRGSAHPPAAVPTQAIEEDRVVETVPGSLVKVPSSLIAKQLSTAAEAPVAGDAADEVMDERWMRAAKEGVKKARISNRIRPTVDPLPSVELGAVVATPCTIDGPAVEPARDTIDDRSPATTENSVDVEEVRPLDPIPLVTTPSEPNSTAPIDFETGAEVDWREPLVPSIPPVFDHWDHADERHTPILWLVQGVNSRRSDPPQRSLFPQYLLDERTDDDVVVGSNVIVDERPFELPPIVESFRPPVVQASDESERGRSKHRRKRSSAAAFGSRWSAARERPRSPVLASAVDRSANDLDTDLNSSDPDHRPESSGYTSVDLPGDSGAAKLPNDETFVAVRSEPAQPLHVHAGNTESETERRDDWSTPLLIPDLQETDDMVVPVGARPSLVPRMSDPEPTGSRFDDIVVHNIGEGPIAYDPAIDGYVIAPEVSRMCRTCSAFRPTDDGERGWCSSEWAFDNRQMVSAWELPCATSFGTWWIPVDAAWQDADQERRDAPTPLYDQLMKMKPQPRKERFFTRKRWS